MIPGGIPIDASEIGLENNVFKLNKKTDKSYREFLTKEYPEITLRQNIIFNDQKAFFLIRLFEYRKIILKARENIRLLDNEEWKEHFVKISHNLNLPVFDNDVLKSIIQNDQFISEIDGDISEYIEI